MKSKQDQSNVESTARSRVGTESVGGRKSEPPKRKFSKPEPSDKDSTEEEDDGRDFATKAAMG